MSKTKQKELPKLEGLKMPDSKSVFRGIFANHLQWIYEPASILMLFVSFYSHKYFYDNREHFHLDERWAFSVACWVPGIVGFWVAGVAFLLLDTITNEKGKLYKQRTTISIWRMLPILIRNHFLHLLICPILTVKLYEHFDIIPRAPSEETVVNVLVSCIFCGFAFEVAFFFCHYLEHVFPKMYAKFHLLHHTTKADVALSGYYMTVVDYFGEGPIPMMMQLVPTIAFGLSSTAVIHGIYLNIFYATTAHSGWKLPGINHPGMHWLHHNHITKIGEARNYATHFDMMDIIWNTKSYEYLEIERRINAEERKRE